MFDELSFLLSTKKLTNIRLDNNRVMSSELISKLNTTTDKNGNEVAIKTDASGLTNSYTVTNVDVKNSELKNYIKSDVNLVYSDTQKNPYIKLLEDFGENSSFPSMKLLTDDFFYLRDLGVFPINRLMILRRYAEGVIVPVDLNDTNAVPISTMIGWVKDENEILSFSVSEKWVTQGSDKMLHLMLNEMISKEFGIKLDSIVPIPAWSVGFVFELMQKMGLTSGEYGRKRVPAGDPNVLKESITRDIDNFGLNSSFDFKLESVYEIKYRPDADLTLTYINLMNTFLKMGTSDTRFIGLSSQYTSSLTNAVNSNTYIAWYSFTKQIITGFISAIKGQLEDITKEAVDYYNNVYVNSPTTDKPTKDPAESDKNETSKTGKQKAEDVQVATQTMKKSLESIGTGILDTLIASTVGKYMWPLRGSIAMFTGQAATPWHLTIGNPYAPILSMNNVLLKDLKVTNGGDFLVNDIPKYLKVEVSLTQGRNMGKNEIYKMIGVKYHRIYTKKAK